jgi:hypothetical protein
VSDAPLGPSIVLSVSDTILPALPVESDNQPGSSIALSVRDTIL